MLSARCAAAISGVPPSPSETKRLSVSSGRSSLYRSIPDAVGSAPVQRDRSCSINKIPSQTGQRYGNPASAIVRPHRTQCILMSGVCLLVNLGDHLDLDRAAEREFGDADRGAGVPAVLAPQLLEQLGGAVDDPRLLPEPRRGRDVPCDLYYLADPAQVAKDMVQFSHAVQGGETRGGVGVLLVHLTPHLALVDVLALDGRGLAGGEDESPAYLRRNVGAGRLRCPRHL